MLLNNIRQSIVLFLDAGDRRIIWTDAAQLLWQSQDGLHDGFCRGHGCRCYVWNIFLSQVLATAVIFRIIYNYIIIIIIIIW